MKPILSRVIKAENQCFIFVTSDTSLENFYDLDFENLKNFDNEKIGIYSLPVKFFDILQDIENEFTKKAISVIIDLYVNTYLFEDFNFNENNTTLN